MGFSFVAAAGNFNDVSGTTLDCTASLNVAAGDLLVCFVSNETSLTTYAVAKTSGSPANTFTFDAGDTISNNVFGQMGYLLSAAADATATFRATWTAAKDFRVFLVMQFRPNSGATVSKDTSSDGTGLGTAANSGNISTTGTDEVVVGMSNLFNAGATTLEKINSVAADGVARQDQSSMWYRLLTSTFSGGAATCTEAISDSWICGVIAFKAASKPIVPLPYGIGHPIMPGPGGRSSLASLLFFGQGQARNWDYSIHPAGGPTVYPQPLTATLDFVGALVKQAVYPLTGALSFVGSDAFRTGKALTATLSFAGALSRKVSRLLTAALSFVGAFTRSTNRALAAALSFVGAFAKRVQRALTATLSFSGAFAASKLAFKALTAALSFAGALSKQTLYPLTGGLSFVGGFAKLTSRAFAGALSFVGAFVRSTLRSMTATLSFSAAFLASKLAFKALTAALSFAGTFAKQANKQQTGALSFIGTFTRRAGKALTASLDFAGALKRKVARTITATLAFAGAFIASRLTLKALTAGLSFAGVFAKQAGKPLAAASLSFAGTITRRTGHTMTAALSFVGAFGRFVKKGLTAALGFVGGLVGLLNPSSWNPIARPGHPFTTVLTASITVSVFSGSQTMSATMSALSPSITTNTPSGWAPTGAVLTVSETTEE